MTANHMIKQEVATEITTSAVCPESLKALYSATLTARSRLKDLIKPTALIKSEDLSKRFGADVYLKPENLQLTGSFKVRGAFNKISGLPPEVKEKGIVAASAGNHSQGVALASQMLGVSATIVMPKTTPLIKVESTKQYGATVILHGDAYDEAAQYAQTLAVTEEKAFIHPFDDVDVMAGQGTIGLEILEELPDADVVLVPIGGGGLAGGVAAVIKQRNPRVKVYGVEPDGAATMLTAMRENKVVDLSHVRTIADGFQIKGRVVHIDLDPTEHQKNLRVDLNVHSDVKAALEALLPQINETRRETWLEQITHSDKAHPQSRQVRWIFDAINEADDEETIYCTDVGQHQMWSAQLIKVPKSRHWISSGGLGTMGFGLGAAFGAKVAHPQKRVVLITGDGSFRMNMAELSSLMDYQLKVDIVLFDNQALGMVRQWQSLFQDHVYSETSIKKGLDYAALAHAFGFKTYYCSDQLGLEQSMTAAKKEPKSTLTVVALHHDEQVFPIVPPGKNFNEMIIK